MRTLFSRPRSSSLALAIALATGTATIATAVFPAEANAQRKRDRDKKDEADGGGYSEAFREVYVPLEEQFNAEGADVAALRPQIQALMPLLTTADEKLAGGNLIYNAGSRLEDNAMRLRGMELMLESGLVPAEAAGQYNFVAYQLANAEGDYDKARRYLQGAIDKNFSTADISASNLRIAMAESYFAQDQLAQGLQYLEDAIAEKKAAGQPVDEQWYKRGVSVAYQNEVTPQVYDLAALWIADYPSPANWKDTVNLTRNLNTFTAQEILDLFRLSRRVDALREPSDYDFYVEAADARRLPGEVKEVIDEGKAAGVIEPNNSFIMEALETAEDRIDADRQELPSLESDAMADSADLATVTAAGSVFLSYDEYDKAARFYERALDMPGVNRNEALTRLGIAQVELGRYDAARETLAQVEGSRAPIARLWMSYANELENAGTAVGTEAVTAAPEMTAG